MKEVVSIGVHRFKRDSMGYRYSVFLCPSCNSAVVRKTRDGLKAKRCGGKCSASHREKRGPYRPFIMNRGYKYIRNLDHPNRTKGGYVAEHRLVAEKTMGRYLEKNEDVHHINGDKTDNRPENLMVLSKSEHMKLHKGEAKRNKDGKFTA